MLKSIKRIIVFSLLFLQSFIIVGCDNQSLEKCIINGKQDYWLLYDEVEPGYLGGPYFKFNDDGVCRRYQKDLNNEFTQINSQGDVVFYDTAWSVSKDSILTWGEHSLDIVDYNENTITLYLNRQDRFLFLFRVNENSARKPLQYYIDKRKEYPEKYPEPYSKL
ncbi:hypothetical protein [Flavobacterium beibuense]|nr:hypothetical protein [Flavobacterium beibuense]